MPGKPVRPGSFWPDQLRHDGQSLPGRSDLRHQRSSRQANRWVDSLDATGGTAINDALTSALELRTKDAGRTFTIVFFTDGQPTIGETNVDRILKNVSAQNTASTRIFTFGVGDDVNAAMLDQLADQTRAVSTYVRPSEDIAAKAAGLYDKISHPVLANLKLAVTGSIALTEVYPPQLPDLFHNQQLVVLGRYTGQGPSALKLTGQVGSQAREFAYDLTFPNKTGNERGFVEEIWARRKVGYMLDQIRLNGEKKELVDEVVALAKRYGITTPYTSYLIVPDGPMPVVPITPVIRPRPMPPRTPPPILMGAAPGAAPLHVAEFARQMQQKPGDLAANRDRLADRVLNGYGVGGRGSGMPGMIGGMGGMGGYGMGGMGGMGGYGMGGMGGMGEAKTIADTRDKKGTYDEARKALARGDINSVQAGKNAVDFALHNEKLRNQMRWSRPPSATPTAGKSWRSAVCGLTRNLMPRLPRW